MRTMLEIAIEVISKDTTRHFTLKKSFKELKVNSQKFEPQNL